MEIPKEIIDQLADEVFAELEAAAKKAGRTISFDDMETAMLMYRQRIGERMMQAAADKVAAGEQGQKKTVRNAPAGQRKKDMRRKRSSD